MTHTTTHYRIRQLVPNDRHLHAVFIAEDGEPYTVEADYIAVCDLTTIEYRDGREAVTRDAGSTVCLVELVGGEFEVCDETSNYAGPCRPGEDAMQVAHHLDGEHRQRRDAWAERTGTTEMIVGGKYGHESD